MKKLTILLGLLVSNGAIDTMAGTQALVDQDKSMMDAIDGRVRNGEKAAMLEEANLEPEVVVPSLIITAKNKSTDPEKAEYARQTLDRIKGIENYLKQKVDDLSGKKAKSDVGVIFERGRRMEDLALIRTNKAIRNIASYLFDDLSPGYHGSDYRLPSNKEEASILLDSMKLEGAPSGIYKTNDDEIAAWRAWWKTNQDKFQESNPYMGKK